MLKKGKDRILMKKGKGRILMNSNLNLLLFLLYFYAQGGNCRQLLQTFWELIGEFFWDS